MSHFGLRWNKISDKLAKQRAMEKEAERSDNNILLSSHEISSVLEQTVYQQLQKNKPVILSCPRYLTRVMYKLSHNTRSTTYSQNVTCICMKAQSVNHILLECSVTTECFVCLFVVVWGVGGGLKDRYDFIACSNVRDQYRIQNTYILLSMNNIEICLTTA